MTNHLERKFVQVYVRGEPFIRFEMGLYHADLLGLILKSEGIEFKTQLNRDEDDRIPTPKGEDAGNEYELVGAGKFTRVGDKITMFDKSFDYRITPNREHLERVKPHLPKDMEFIITN
mgnify:CR=1 FL=1